MPRSKDHRPLVAAQRRERMRIRLEQAALQAVVALGSVPMSIDEFLARAQVSRGTFYKYFPDMASLVQSMAQSVSDELIAHLHSVVQQHEDAAERIAVGMLAVLQLVQRLPALGALVTRTGWPHAEIGDAHAFNTLVRADIEFGLKQKRFAKMDVGFALDLTAGAVIAGAHHIVSGSTAPRFVHDVVAAALRALGICDDDARALARLKIVLPPIAEGTMLATLAARSQTTPLSAAR
jgi:TetR/AcrR family transcriptional regulator, ethionamide resistance regulator